MMLLNDDRTYHLTVTYRDLLLIMDAFRVTQEQTHDLVMRAALMVLDIKNKAAMTAAIEAAQAQNG